MLVAVNLRQEVVYQQSLRACLDLGSDHQGFKDLTVVLQRVPLLILAFRRGLSSAGYWCPRHNLLYWEEGTFGVLWWRSFRAAVSNKLESEHISVPVRMRTLPPWVLFYFAWPFPAVITPFRKVDRNLLCFLLLRSLQLCNPTFRQQAATGRRRFLWKLWEFVCWRSSQIISDHQASLS